MSSSIESQNSLEAGFDSTVPAPRFGIFHLLSLTAGIALAFGLVSATSDALARISPEATQYRAIFFFVGAGNGLFYAGMAWLFKWKLQTSFKLQPGHWLIIAAGTLALTSALANLIQFSLYRIQEISGDNFRTYMLLFAVAHATSAVLYGTASWMSKGIWKWSFCAYGLHALLVTSYTLSEFRWIGFRRWWGMGSGCVFLAALVLFLIAIVVDLKSRQRRDWVHWFGIFAFVYNGVIENGLPYVIFMF